MPEPDKTTLQNPEQVLQQPTRETSQTDHINKKLLSSLFQRMNEGGDSLLSNMLEDDDNPVTEDEWKD